MTNDTGRNAPVSTPMRVARSRSALTPAFGVSLLVVISFALRLIFGASVGLGVDESYMVAAGRELQLSYFDHPPISWWLAWGATHLGAGDAALVVRLPFIALFAVSTWLMFRLTAALFDERAGLWAALAFNLAPVLGITTASWVLPDGPLVCALLTAIYCLSRVLFGDPRQANRWWLLFGAACGMALLSKYSAILVIAGAGLFLVSSPPHRHWLVRPQPYIALAIAALMFAPVILWNAEHHWASFSFQGGRAAPASFHPWGPLATLAGEALWLLPWIWLLLIGQFIHGASRGRADPRRWLLCCLGALPILLFVVIAAWASRRVLFHWAVPGYLMMFPLAGDWLSRCVEAKARWIKPALVATIAFELAGLAIFATEIHFNWLAAIIGNFKGAAAETEVIDWSNLRTDMTARGLLGRGNTIIAATRWNLAGKIDYALKGALPVVCLCDDAREFGLVRPLAAQQGRDVLIIDRNSHSPSVVESYGTLFDSIEPLPPLEVLQAGRAALELNLYLGRNLQLSGKKENVPAAAAAPTRP